MAITLSPGPGEVLWRYADDNDMAYLSPVSWFVSHFATELGGKFKISRKRAYFGQVHSDGAYLRIIDVEARK